MGASIAGETKFSSENVVMIHPYFKLKEGKTMDEFKALWKDFIPKMQSEGNCVFYEFCFTDDAAYCREGYIGAEGVLAHLANVEETLGKVFGYSMKTRTK